MPNEYMITLKKKNKIYKYEGLWRKKFIINKKDYDYQKRVIPYPKSSKQKWQKKIFMEKLVKIEKILILNKKFIKLPIKQVKNCIFNDEYEVDSIHFYISNHLWSNGLMHYIKNHNIKPSDEFIDFIMSINFNKLSRTKNTKKEILNIPAISIIKYDKKYFKLSKNQILIMDALMKHGSSIKRYQDEQNKNKFRYSEHSGLLDFYKKGLEKIIISGKTTRIDTEDDDIYLPENMIDAYDYEYFFHTHPATPKPGGRADMGILYEFPSTNDILHFVEHYNNGITQGSIVIAPEGLYIIRKNIINDKKIKIKNENKLFNIINNLLFNTQKKAIKKYGTRFSLYTYYSKIAQDFNYIKNINDTLNKFDIHIDYYSRKKDSKGRWVINSLYLPVYVIEKK
jgi:hypothetical protein